MGGCFGQHAVALKVLARLMRSYVAEAMTSASSQDCAPDLHEAERYVANLMADVKSWKPSRTCIAGAKSPAMVIAF